MIARGTATEPCIDGTRPSMHPRSGDMRHRSRGGIRRHPIPVTDRVPTLPMALSSEQPVLLILTWAAIP